MASWWKTLARDMGVTGGSGSWPKRIAQFLSAADEPGRSWAGKIAKVLGTSRTSGSWEARVKGNEFGPAAELARTLVLGGQQVLLGEQPVLLR